MTDTTTPPAASEPQPKQDPTAELMRKVKSGITFARSQMTPPSRNGKPIPGAKSRAEKFEIKAELEKAVTDLEKAATEAQGWIDLLPSIMDRKGNLDPEDFEASIVTSDRVIRKMEQANNRLQGVLDELTVRRCEANVDSIGRAIAILEGPKWKGPTVDLKDAKKALKDLQRVVRTRSPWPRIAEHGDDAVRSVWKLIEGRCYTCGSQLPKGFHGHFCDPCHSAHLAEQRKAEEDQAMTDSNLLARLRQQIKQNKS